MSDIFEVQDEIAHKIAEALRIKLTPQEQAELAAKPTENLQAYDLYLRGPQLRPPAHAPGHGVRPPDVRERGRARPQLRPRLGGDRQRLRPVRPVLVRRPAVDGARPARVAAGRGARARLPEVLVSQAWILYAGGQYDDAVRLTRAAIARKRDCEGAYYLLLRALFASGKYQEVADLAEEAIEAAGTTTTSTSRS